MVKVDEVRVATDSEVREATQISEDIEQTASPKELRWVVGLFVTIAGIALYLLR